MHIITADLLAHIGRSPSAADMDAWLSSQRIRHRPFLAKDDPDYRKDHYEAEKRAEASEIDEVERHSIALIYDQAEDYAALYGPLGSGPEGQDRGPFVLREAAFYGPGVQNYKGYEDALPFGLRFGMSGEAAFNVMGPPLARRTVHELRTDLWAHDGWIVNASYLDEDANLGLVHVRRPHLFDRKAGDARVREALAPIGFDPADFDFSDEGEILKFQRSHGVTLYFGDHGQSAATLSGLRVQRLGDLRSLGWGGQLPHGIEFHTTPRELEALVARKPDKVSMAADTGAFLWRFKTHELHVMFSLIDFQVYRVSVFLPH
jgi:hypothetical protein